MLQDDFSYRQVHRRLSPQPMLLALNGISRSYYSYNTYQSINIDVDCSLRKGDQADVHEFYLKLIDAIQNKAFFEYVVVLILYYVCILLNNNNRQEKHFNKAFCEEIVTGNNCDWVQVH